MTIRINSQTLKGCVLALLMFIPFTSLQAGEPALAVSMDVASHEWGGCPPFFVEGCGIAVLHGDPSQPNVDVLFRYPAGESFPEHWHTSAERLVMLQGTFELTYEGQETATLEAGMYAFGPAKRKHSGTCVSDEECVLFIAFNEPVDAHEVVSDAGME